jgi:hypothetical protein
MMGTDLKDSLNVVADIIERREKKGMILLFWERSAAQSITSDLT